MVQIGTGRGARSRPALGDAPVAENDRDRQGRGLAPRSRNSPLASRRAGQPRPYGACAHRRQERPEGRRDLLRRGLQRLYAAPCLDAGDSGSGIDRDDAVQGLEVEHRSCGRRLAGAVAGASHP